MNARIFELSIDSMQNARAFSNIFDLMLGESLQFDFDSVSLNGQRFNPQGVIVDCSKSDGDCEIVVMPINICIKCKAGGMVQMPYPAIPGQSVTIKGDGSTGVVFVDYTLFPYSSDVTSSGGGGGGGGGDGKTGRSTMFHGFEVQAVSGTSSAGVPSSMGVVITTHDPDGWVTGGNVVVPDGVSKVRLSATTKMIDADGNRPLSQWATVGGKSALTGAYTTPNPAVTQPIAVVVDFGIIDVTPGDPMPFVCVTPLGENPGASMTIYCEVVEGDILNT